MNVIDWFRAGRRKRLAELDERVLAELRRLGEADALAVRGGVRTQYAVVQASLARLEQAGKVGSRRENPAGKPPRQVYFLT